MKKVAEIAGYAATGIYVASTLAIAAGICVTVVVAEAIKMRFRPEQEVSKRSLLEELRDECREDSETNSEDTDPHP